MTTCFEVSGKSDGMAEMDSRSFRNGDWHPRILSSSSSDTQQVSKCPQWIANQCDRFWRSVPLFPDATPNMSKDCLCPGLALGRSMINIDRRRLLTSFAATTVCAPAVSTINAADALVRRGAIHHGSQPNAGWFLAREPVQQLTNHAVDFWERDFCDIAYSQYLPREITRGAMCYQAFDGPNQPTLVAIDRSMKDHCRDWVGRPRIAAHLDGIETLSSTLKSLIEEDSSNSTTRTAFLSLDSLSPSPMREPNWADVLPAFRSCYDHIIGHFHLPQRGLRQYRQFLNTHSHSDKGAYFQQFFTDAAVQCDAVILTSSALCERDFHCCPYASTEELVGQLMRQLGCALLTPAVLERVVEAGEAETPRKPRLFALASLGLWTMDDYFLAYPNIFGLQYELVHCSFGSVMLDEQPLHVVTAVENLQSDLVDEVRRAAGGSFFTTTTPSYEYDVEKLGHPSLNDMKMITLWPFEFDEEKLRSA
jgi:hypothetical protein